MAGFYRGKLTFENLDVSWYHPRRPRTGTDLPLNRGAAASMINVNGAMSGVKRALSGAVGNGNAESDYTPTSILLTGGAGACLASQPDLLA